MIFIAFAIISMTPCDRFMELMATSENVREAKLNMVTMRKYLTPQELDKGVLHLLHRIHDTNPKVNSNPLRTTAQDREELTVFLMRISRMK